MSYWKMVFLPPMKPGVYVVIGRETGKVEYVGSSVNLYLRVSQHKWMREGDWVVKVKPSRRKGDWLMEEYRLIERLQPTRNVRHIEGRRLRMRKRRVVIETTEFVNVSEELLKLLEEDEFPEAPKE